MAIKIVFLLILSVFGSGTSLISRLDCDILCVLNLIQISLSAIYNPAHLFELARCTIIKVPDNAPIIKIVLVIVGYYDTTTYPVATPFLVRSGV